MDPNYTNAYYNRGITYSKLGQYQPAIQDLDATIRLEPAKGNAFYARGFAHEKLGQYEAAIADYNEAIRLKPDDARPRDRKRMVLSMAGIREGANPRGETGQTPIPIAPNGYGCASVPGIVETLQIGDDPPRKYELPLCGSQTK